MDGESQRQRGLELITKVLQDENREREAMIRECRAQPITMDIFIREMLPTLNDWINRTITERLEKRIVALERRAARDK